MAKPQEVAKFKRGTKFYVQLSSGEKFQISQLDFNNLTARHKTGRHHGTYDQRADCEGSNRHKWTLQMKDIATFWADSPEMVDVPDRNLDIEKRLPRKVGKKEEPKPPCGHNWNNQEDFEFHVQIVGGNKRYYKVCKKCNSKSTLIKTREVELAMLDLGKTLDDVPVLE